MPTGRTDSPEAKRNLVERSRPRPRVPRATKGAVDDCTHFPRALLLTNCFSIPITQQSTICALTHRAITLAAAFAAGFFAEIGD